MAGGCETLRACRVWIVRGCDCCTINLKDGSPSWCCHAWRPSLLDMISWMNPFCRHWDLAQADLGDSVKGTLPPQDIADLYSSAKLVIGTTDIAQRQLGMINNRVFEALSCGAVLITDCFPALKETFGSHVLCAANASDVARHLRSVVVTLLLSSRLSRFFSSDGGVNSPLLSSPFC
jgi:hypothetical protein